MTSFDPHRLTLARWAAGTTKTDLARELGLSPASVSQYEAGNTAPPSSVVAQMALVLGVHSGYFERSSSRRAPSTATRSFFRSLRATRQWERDQADALTEHAYDLVSFVEQRIRLPGIEIPALPVGSGASRQEVEVVAGDVRRAWALEPARPIANVVRLIEANGVVVCRLRAGSDRVDAFSRWFSSRPVVVLWDGKNDKARSRFDTAHELGHLVMHHEPEFSDQVQERQAHAFAAALLMPAEVIVDHLPRRPPRAADWEQLKAAQRRWGVSVAALLYRARELGTLTEAGFRRAMTRYNQLGLRATDGQALGEPERPRLLVEAVETLLTHRAWTLDDLAEALLFNRRQLQQILGEVATEDGPSGGGREAGDVVVPFRRG
jgi:Zn-dependent peptidase ImmA (M78 family)/transcriptional regulator with XRE-family HTH domain